MAGRFSRDNRPLLPGGYFNVEAVAKTIIQPNSGSIVAIPIVHTWGPTGAVLCQSAAEFEAIYGSDLSAGRTAVLGAFRGEDVEGWGGAGGVLAYRMVGSAGAVATRLLTNTTPVTAVTLTTVYKGTRGNRLNVAVIDTAGDATRTDLILYDGTTEIERYTFLDADTQDLVDQINAGSSWIRATRQAAGPLTIVTTPAALTGGNDGSTLVAGDWTATLSALEVEKFGLFSPYDLTDSGILESLRVWARDLNRNGKRFRTVVGGPSNDTASTALARTVALQDAVYPDSAADFINLGCFVYTDATFGALSSSQAAPRYAGVLAQRGEAHSATKARLGGVTDIVSGPTKAQEIALFKGGVVSIGRDSDPVAPINFGAAVSAYTKKSAAIDAVFPWTVFRSPKFVATMHGIETEMTDYAEQYVIGKTQINNKTREAFVGEMGTRLEARVPSGIIQPNPTAAIDQDPPPTDDDEFIAAVYGIKFGRTAEQIYGTLRVS